MGPGDIFHWLAAEANAKTHHAPRNGSKAALIPLLSSLPPQSFSGRVTALAPRWPRGMARLSLVYSSNKSFQLPCPAKTFAVILCNTIFVKGKLRWIAPKTGSLPLTEIKQTSRFRGLSFTPIPFSVNVYSESRNHSCGDTYTVLYSVRRHMHMYTHTSLNTVRYAHTDTALLFSSCMFSKLRRVSWGNENG